MKRDNFLNSNANTSCAFCASSKLTSAYHSQLFDYGSDDNRVQLEAIVPVWTCADCGEEFTDDVAEELRHEAVCRHLHRLTPNEIYEIRKSNNLSQDALADLTGFGIASIKRWERGNQIQSESADRLLRVVRDHQGLKILRSLRSTELNTAPLRPVIQSPKFRTTLLPSARREALEFRLHRKDELQAA